MKLNPIRFCLSTIVITLCGLLQANPSQIVGYCHTRLQKGNNRIEINFDAVNPLFSTMDMVLKFVPADGVLGDEIIFPLDGKMRHYRFDSYDGTNYTLSAVREAPPFTITIDAIPWMSEVWIEHNNSMEVDIAQAGATGGKYERWKREWERASKHQAVATPVVITLVDSDDPQKLNPICLKGGHISLGD